MVPITRDEQFLAAAAGEYSGELPEPVARQEHFLRQIVERFKAIADGGGGGNNDFIINYAYTVIDDGSEILDCDKTAAEIYAAFEADKNIKAFLDGGDGIQIPLQMIGCADDGMTIMIAYYLITAAATSDHLVTTMDGDISALTHVSVDGTDRILFTSCPIHQTFIARYEYVEEGDSDAWLTCANINEFRVVAQKNIAFLADGPRGLYHLQLHDGAYNFVFTNLYVDENGDYIISTIRHDINSDEADAITYDETVLGGSSSNAVYNDASLMFDTSKRIAFTPVTGNANTTDGGCYYYKIGTKVHLHVSMTGLSANTSTLIYTMPVGCRPDHMVAGRGIAGTMATHSMVRITTDGSVGVNSESTAMLADVEFDAVQ